MEESKIVENAFLLRNTTLKTDLIDVDLVRGSTFPKAKPKQSLLQVLYLSILRYIFLPLFSKWWVKETSAKVFVVLLSLYFLQMINWAIYSLHIRNLNENDDNKANGEEEVDLCELLIPMGLSLLLCFIHSQIVATSVFPSRTSNNKRRHKVSNFGKNRINGCDKMKRKKKLYRQRVSNGGNHTKDLEKMQGYDSDDEQSVIMHQKAVSTVDKDLLSSISMTSQEINSSTPQSVMRHRRNVNWDLNNSNSSNNNNSNNRPPLQAGLRSIEDDGFESFTGKSSSGEDLRQNQKKDTDSDTDTLKNSERSTPIKMSRKEEKRKHLSDSEEVEFNDSLTPSSSNHFDQTTDGEYMIGVTSNSESDQCEDDDYCSDDDNVPTKILNPNDSSEKVTVTLWTKQSEAKKGEMNAFDISSAIIQRVDSIPETYDYIYIGMVFAFILALTPAYCRLCDLTKDTNSSANNLFDLPKGLIDESFTFSNFMQLAFGQNFWIRILYIIAIVQRLVLAFIFFFLLAVAERTFKQR